MSGRRQQRVMLPPINLIFLLFQKQLPTTIWLYEQVDSRIEGVIKGFDEFMNLVIDNAVEISVKGGNRRELGMILLKGDNITLISSNAI